MRYALVLSVFLTACGSVQQMTPVADTATEEVRRLEREWNDAIDRRDTASLDKYLAPTYFLAIGVQGQPLQIVPRERWLTNLEFYDIQSYNIDDMRVNVYGDVAVVTMLFTQQALVGEQRRDRSAQFFLTDIWVRSGDSWQVAERHSSRPEIAPPRPATE